MFQIDPLSFIPQAIKDAVADALVDLVSSQAKKLLGDEVAGKIKKLRSDATFRASFETGLNRAVQRFMDEYEKEDEDLVQVIAGTPGFFQNAEVQAALLKIVQNPGSFQDEDKNIVIDSFTSVFPNRKNRERVDRAVSYLLKCLAEELWHLPELQPVYALQFQRLTAEALKQQVALQQAQLQALAGLNTGVRDALLQLTNAIADQKQLPPGETKAELKAPLVLHNLPNRSYGKFIGRENELRRISQLLHPDSRHFVITIDGIGGIGKSTLALEIAHRYLHHAQKIPEAERFSAIIWTSAKQTVLTADGVMERPQVLRTLADIYKTIAITLQREDITKAPVEAQADLVCIALTRQRTLLIVDNLETIDDERVLSFLRELPAPTKAIVTTRHRIDVAYPIRLKEMGWEEARAYIHQQCKYKGVVLDEAQAERLYRLSGGIPLAINWSLALTAKGLEFEEVMRRLGEAGSNDITSFCFQSSTDIIRSKPAYHLMLSLALFNPDASREALGQVANLSKIERDDGLAELENLSLVNKTGGRFAFLPLTKSFAIRELKNNPDFHLAAGRRWLSYLKDLGRVTDDLFWPYLYNDEAIKEGSNFLEGIEWAYQFGSAEDVFELTRCALNYLDTKGLWNEIDLYVSRALSLAKSINRENAIAMFDHILAWLYEQWGLYQEALGYSEESLSLYQKMDSIQGQVKVFARLSGIHRKLHHFDTAREMCDQGLALCNKVQDGDLSAVIDSAYGKLYRDLGDWDQAREYFTRVQEWFQKRTELSPADENLARGTAGQLAYVATHLGRAEEAKNLFQQSMNYFESYGTKGYLATLTYRLALTEEVLGESDAARAHARQALELFDRLGMKPDYNEAKKLLDRLQ